MSEPKLKPCPIPGCAAPASESWEDRAYTVEIVGCSNDDCQMLPLPVPVWQALPRLSEAAARIAGEMDAYDKDREVIAAATDGPWAWAQPGQKENGFVIGATYPPHEGFLEEPLEEEFDDYPEVADLVCEQWAATVNYGDAEFITRARTRYPELVEENARLQAVVDAAREVARWDWATVLDDYDEMPVLLRCLTGLTAALDALDNRGGDGNETE